MTNNKPPFDITTYTPSELADKLQVAEATLRKWRSEGTGPKFFKLGKKSNSEVRYMRSWVDQWISENKVG
mgnify:CR=1 FL=1|tara:strand:+ start:64 stop:273 length:210 start_codon:yes stop_codon:yes gene_type:complete